MKHTGNKELSTLNKIKLNYNITSWSEHKLNYWAVPKCANTAIKVCLHGTRFSNNEYSKEKWVHNPKNLNYITDVDAFNNGYTNFSVIRHPYDRFISLFKDQGMQRPLKKIYNKASNMVGDLDYFIESVFSLYPTDDACDPHVRSISYYLCKDNMPRFNNIILLDEAKNFLKKYNIVFRQYNKTDPGVEVILSDRHKLLIQERYKEDFNIFGFKK